MKALDPFVFGTGLKNIRNRQNLTLKALAEKANIPEASLSKFESGSRVPTLQSFVRLCHALNATPNDLLRGEFSIDIWVLSIEAFKFRQLKQVFEDLKNEVDEHRYGYQGGDKNENR